MGPASSFSGPFVRLIGTMNDRTIVIDITQLHVDEIKLFHHLLEISEIVEIDEIVE